MSARVLLIDDNQDLAENLAELLADEGFEAIIAGTGEQALDTLAEQHFDLVITDMRMPGMSGLEVIRQVARRWPGLPVVVMTAYTRDAVLSEAQRAGAIGILPKPFDMGHFVEVVSRCAPPNAPVLLVEDDDDLRVNLAEALWEVAEIVTISVRDVVAAKEVAERVGLRAAIIDVRLPDGSGTDVGKAIEASDVQCPIIYITGYGEELEGTLREVLEAPSVKLLEKPFAPEKLIEIVRGAL